MFFTTTGNVFYYYIKPIISNSRDKGGEKLTGLVKNSDFSGSRWFSPCSQLGKHHFFLPLSIQLEGITRWQNGSWDSVNCLVKSECYPFLLCGGCSLCLEGSRGPGLPSPTSASNWASWRSSTVKSSGPCHWWVPKGDSKPSFISGPATDLQCSEEQTSSYSAKGVLHFSSFLGDVYQSLRFCPFPREPG